MAQALPGTCPAFTSYDSGFATEVTLFCKREDAHWLHQDPVTGLLWAEREPDPGALEALASAWEDQAAGQLARMDEAAAHAADPAAAMAGLAKDAENWQSCARMLREAIAHGGQG